MPEDYALPNFAYPDGHYRDHVYDLYAGTGDEERGDFVIRLANNSNSRDISLVYDMMRELIFIKDLNYLPYESSDSGSTGTNSDLGSDPGRGENLTSDDEEGEGEEANSKPRAMRNRRRKRRAVRRNRLRLAPGQFHTDMRLNYLMGLLLYHRRPARNEVVPIGFMLFSECFYQGLGGPGLFLDQYAIHPLFYGKHLGTHLHAWLFEWLSRTPPIGEALVDNCQHSRYYFIKTVLKQKKSLLEKVLSSVNIQAHQPSLEMTYYEQLGFRNESDYLHLYEMCHWTKIDEMLRSEVGASAYQLKDILVKEKLLTRSSSKFSLKLVTAGSSDDNFAAVPNVNLSASSLDKLPSDEKEKKRSSIFKLGFGSSSHKVNISASAGVSGGGASAKLTIGGKGSKSKGSESPATQPAPVVIVNNRQPKVDSIKCSFVCQQVYYGLSGAGVWISELQGDLSLLSAPLLRGVIRQSRDKLLQEGGSRLWAVVVEFAGSRKEAFVKQVLKQEMKLTNITRKQGFQLHHLAEAGIGEDLGKYGPMFGIGEGQVEAVPY